MFGAELIELSDLIGKQNSKKETRNETYMTRINQDKNYCTINGINEERNTNISSFCYFSPETAYK